MKKARRRIPKSWIFWGFSCFFIIAIGTAFLFFQSPLSEDAFRALLKKEMLGKVEFKNLQFAQKSFDWKSLTWAFDVKVEVTQILGVPLKVKNLSLEGTKKIFQSANVKKAVLRFAEDDKVFKGGATLNQASDGRYLWDLSNLEISLGAFKKKMGQSAFLSFKPESTKTQGIFTHDGVNIPLELSYTGSSIVLQIPQVQVETATQRLPFSFLNDVPTSGRWTLASRIEFKNENISEASSLKVDQALFALANMKSSLLRNGRGVGVLSAELSSAEGLVNGNFFLDLKKATFELNEGFYFKAENVPFKVSGELIQNLGSLKVEVADSKLEADILKDDRFEARLQTFDLALIPEVKKVLGSYQQGIFSGEISGVLRKDVLSTALIEVDTLRGDEVEIDFENLALPALKTEGLSTYAGKLLFERSKKKAHFKGRLDMRNSRLALGTFYTKESGVPLRIELEADKVDKSWISFQAKAWVEEQAVELKADSKEVTFSFPQSFRSKRGLLSGFVKYALCEEDLCETTSPLGYSLKFSDYQSEVLALQGLRLSGKIEKKRETMQMQDFSIAWPSGDRVLLTGNLEKDKKANLQIRGDFDFKSVETSPTFSVFKEYLVKNGTYDLNLSLKKGASVWKFKSQATLSDKKLSLDKVLLEHGKQSYAGVGAIDLEPFLLRNDAATLTATLRSSGRLEIFEKKKMKGSYDAQLVVASSGLNPGELLANLQFRASGDARFDKMPLIQLVGEGLESYAKEKQKGSARSLSKCYPKKVHGKFDFDYSNGKINLSQSAFQGTDTDSIVKLQGALGDMSSINVLVNYLPGFRCAPSLASCLGDAFPKGGMAFELTGAFRDPETDFDFALIDKSLERCREKESQRGLANENKIDTRDQKIRIKELKDFYNSRKRSP